VKETLGQAPKDAQTTLNAATEALEIAVADPALSAEFGLEVRSISSI
jgi:hypothetical protein